ASSKKIKIKQSKITPVQLIVLGYFFFALLGAALLSLPIALNPGVQISFINALFTATSAISVTGLTVVTIHETFSNFGLAILMIYFQLGGIGIMTLGTLMYVALGQRIGLKNRIMMKIDQNSTSLSGLVRLMLFIFKIAVILQVIGTIILTAHFYLNYDYALTTAFKLGLFHAMSGFTNAGFDLFGNSLQGFPTDYFLHAVIGILIILGAIGFPVLMEVKSWLLKQRHRFTVFTKVSLITYFALLVAGVLVILSGEIRHALAGLPWHQQLSVAIFQSITTRSGGLSTYNVSLFSTATLTFFCLLMFIGGSPSSCGGGIRTTTFAVISLSLISLWQGKSHVNICRREIYTGDINRAHGVFTIAIVLVLFPSMLMLKLEPFSATAIFFEVCSAFGTCGLSTGITPDLTTTSKLILIILMFIGRIGLLALLLLPYQPGKKPKIHYVKERLIIG
ncbi:TrkH family potassium uptake protein, partial [Peptococcaceae bacterium]|nr:TrkH family potassium uptake protein [Peptococcaceae bacterium]